MNHPAHRVAALALLAALAVTGARADEVAPGGADATTPAGGANAIPHTVALPGIPGHEMGAMGDVPAGPGAIRGRLVHVSESAQLGGLTVVLYAIRRTGEPGLRAARTDETGAFAFESIDNGPAIVYLLGTRYAEIPFGARFAFEAGQLERRIDLPVADATADASGAAVGEVRIAAEQSCAGLLVNETHRLENPGARAIFIPEAERAGREPILRVPLPEGAFDPQSELGDGLARDGDVLVYWGPLRPGEQELRFSYRIPARGPAFELRRGFPSGARRLVLERRPDGPKLARGGSDDAPLAPGETVALRVELPAAAADVDRLSALETRVWLELDDAAFTVDQQYTLAVAGDRPLRSDSGAPLLCIPLPAGASDLRFSSQTLALGTERDPSGALAVRGPLPVGESEIALRFLLPTEREAPLFSQVMPLDTPLVTVLVADTGIAVETDRLHRKRPVRRPDRSFLHLEAFEFAAGEALELRLRPLEARRALPAPAAAGIALAAAAIAIGFLVAPLRETSAEASELPSAAAQAADERGAVLRAIHGLDEDFEIGRMSEPDYQAMRQTLRAEAVELLRAERAALAETAASGPGARAAAAPRGEPGADEAATRACPDCAAEVSADARFCSQCGVALDPRERTGEAARV